MDSLKSDKSELDSKHFLPAIIIPDLYLLPSMLVPMIIKDPIRKKLIDTCTKKNSLIAVVTPEQKISIAEGCSKIVGVAQIKIMEKYNSDQHIILSGIGRWLATQISQEIPHIALQGSMVKSVNLDYGMELNLMAELRVVSLEWTKQNHPKRVNVLQYLRTVNSLEELMNFMASHVLLNHQDRARFLDNTSLLKQFSMLYNKTIESLSMSRAANTNANNVISLKNFGNPPT